MAELACIKNPHIIYKMSVCLFEIRDNRGRAHKSTILWRIVAVHNYATSE
jgi:hypothetical protein